MGHGELRLATGIERAWHDHGEVLLRLVIRRWESRELGIVGALIEGGAEFVERVRAVSIFGTFQQRDHNRNVHGARQGVLRLIFSPDPNTIEFGWNLTGRLTCTVRC